MRGFRAALLIMSLAAVSPAALAQDCHPLAIFTSVALVHREGDARMYVPVFVRDTQKLMLLDTGAPLSEITSQAAAELKLQHRLLNTTVVNRSGETSDQAAMVPAFSIGSLKMGTVQMIIAPETRLVGDDPRVAGVIAPDILSGFDVDIEFGASKLSLLSPDHCEGKVIYWPASAVAVVPMQALPSGHILIPAKLDGKAVTALIDSGMPTTSLRRAVAEGPLGLKAPDEAAGHHRFQSLDFDGVAIGNLDVAIAPESAPLGAPSMADNADLRIGMDVLKHLHIYVAYREHKLYITPAAAAAP